MRVPEQEDYVCPENDSGTWVFLKFIESLHFAGNSFEWSLIWFSYINVCLLPLQISFPALASNTNLLLIFENRGEESE